LIGTLSGFAETAFDPDSLKGRCHETIPAWSSFVDRGANGPGSVDPDWMRNDKHPSRRLGQITGRIWWRSSEYDNGIATSWVVLEDRNSMHRIRLQPEQFGRRLRGMRPIPIWGLRSDSKSQPTH
jgi:hypothetical protein